MEHRIIIVSNRLPFTVSQAGDRLVLEQSAGGLLPGLSAWLESLTPVREAHYIWVGWPGIEVAGQRRVELDSTAEARFNAYPVHVSTADMESFYEGFCNRTIWPLFHYFPQYVSYDEADWQTYKRVNEVFRDRVLAVLRPGDVVWVHDYHLMLLPGLLKASAPDSPVGFFLHIPFPGYELLRSMPQKWYEQLLNGLLSADLVGFHSEDYTEHFFSATTRLLQLEREGDFVIAEGGGRRARVGTYPMGIDFHKYASAAASAEVQEQVRVLRRGVGDKKIVLTLDRLDYTKGIINRLEGYELFLHRNPAWHGKVVLALAVTPSRVGVQHYEETKQQIEGLVGKINGDFGTLSWSPILYQYRVVPLTALSTMYVVSDVALVTPLRDGMNLVAKEYLASRVDNRGALILSTLAGAAAELKEAILINPNSREEIAEALKSALEMPEEEQIERNRAMRDRLERFSLSPWARQFIHELLDTYDLQR